MFLIMSMGASTKIPLLFWKNTFRAHTLTCRGKGTVEKNSAQVARSYLNGSRGTRDDHFGRSLFEVIVVEHREGNAFRGDGMRGLEFRLNPRFNRKTFLEHHHCTGGSIRVRWSYRFIPVADDLRVVLMLDSQFELGLEAGLVEARERLASVNRLEVREDHFRFPKQHASFSPIEQRSITYCRPN